MMQRHRRFHFVLLGLLPALALNAVVATAAPPIEFQLTFDPAVRSEPFSGRVLIFLSKDSAGEPRLDYSWMTRRPLFSMDVKKWEPGKVLRVADPAGFPYDAGELPPGKYRVQAVMHTNPDVPHDGDAPGNLYSRAGKATLDPEIGGVVKLTINRIVEAHDRPMRFGQADVVELKSACLSKFYGRDIRMRAVVIKPEAYDTEPDRKFPTIYVIPGFGGDHFESGMYSMMLGRLKTPFVRVGLDPTCAHGHHVFADSDNDGPCGRALVEEMIPHLEKTYRLIPDSHARFLTGHSSGGWSSLWVQITHPDYFGGTWSTSPDPVDFHDFCGVNLYEKNANMFRTSDGTRRPIMREDGKVKLYAQDFIRREDVLGPGGQIDSFEAVFGRRGDDGRPVRMFDRKTGKVNPDVVKVWRRFDIADKLKREWPELGPKLAGKITIIMGGSDTFYLEGATKRLKSVLEKLGSDARVIIVPDRDHGTIMWSEPFRKMYDEMSERFRTWQESTGAATTQPAH